MEKDRARTDAETIEGLLAELEAEIARLEDLLQNTKRRSENSGKTAHRRRITQVA
ncbi:MAG: hypothetical protein ACFHX7_22860 [Pseudomonadota bacterium]